MGRRSGWYSDRSARLAARYAVAFVVLAGALGLGEALGLPRSVIGGTFLVATFAVYALFGSVARTATIAEYYVAGRQVPAVFNGMATAADWLSAASFLSLAGAIFVLGYDGLAYILGWTGGFVLLAVFVAPYLRKFGQYTLPDFLAARYGGNLARGLGVVATVTASFGYLVAQVTGVGIILSRFLGLDFALAVVVGLAGILICSLAGGMKAITWAQVAQYLVVVLAYLVPVVLLSWRATGNPFAPLTYGRVVQRIDARQAELARDPAEQAVRTVTTTAGTAAPAAPAPFLAPFARTDRRNMLALMLCLMVGTAGLPHLLTRYHTVPSVREARASIGWSVAFILVLYLAAPAYATFARWEVLSSVFGAKISALPDWMASWSKVGLLSFRDANGDGILQLGELTLGGDAVVLATPEIARLPWVVAGLVAAGGLAAALSTADGLLLTISNALAHDLFYKILFPGASIRRRLAVSRLLLVATAAVAGWAAALRPTTIIELVAWAFSITAAALFPAVVLGIWDKRANRAGAVAGMAIGLATTLFYLIGNQLYGLEWWGIHGVAAGVFGLPAGLVTIVVVSRLTRAPHPEMQDFVESLRYPRGAAGGPGTD